MDLRWLDLEALITALTRPSFCLGFGLVGLGLSAFAWPYFPYGHERVAFCSMFSLGITVICACVGKHVDTRAPRRRRRLRRSNGPKGDTS
jgi:hypothetical protein